MISPPSKDANNNNLYIESIRFTFYDANSSANRLGVSELFYIQPEGVSAYEGLAVKYSNNGDVIINEGKIGMGTNTPYGNSKLDITGEYAADKFDSQLHLHTTSNTYGMFLGSHSAGYGAISQGSHYYSSHQYRARSTHSSGIINYNGRIRFFTDSNLTAGNLFSPSIRLAINADGNVGIGTTDTHGYKLAVNGTIGSKEVKVETSSPWPDYVFSDTYKLNSLSEVSAYIKENKHLPGIPSTDEVEENGIKLGEMNAKLLQKIEELTLYLIKQNGKIELLTKDNIEMKKLVEQQQERLEKLEN